MARKGFVGFLEDLVFKNRAAILVVFTLITGFMAYQASKLKIDAGFTKLLPLEHPYMKTFMEHRTEFGGANRVLIAVMAKDGDMFDPQFMDTLKKVTDEVFFVPGVDRAQVSSLFTPNTRFTEVVEDGIAGGNVVPDDYTNDEEGIEKVRKNILKSGIVGRLIANDFSGAIVSANLLEVDPNTGERLDFIRVAKDLEEKIREKYQNDEISIHIIGFAKVIGDIAEGATRVILFFGIAFLITALLVYIYTQSFKLTVIPLLCSIVAVVWQLGGLTLLGFGIDPMSILVPFLVFAIGVSHGVQMVSANGAEVFDGATPMEAARASFRKLLVPGSIALASDTIGFITILLIEIQVIQEMAITASLGVAVIILTNLILLPILLSTNKYADNYVDKLHRRSEQMAPIWQSLSAVASRRLAVPLLILTVILFVFGYWYGKDVKIGDLHRGVPELRAESRYNMDTDVITEHFSIGVDIINVIVETVPDACIDYQIMRQVEDFGWYIRNVQGVQSVISMPIVAKIINAGWNEGSMKWRILPRNQSMMAQSVTYIPTSTGLLNANCSVMPVMIFTADHKAETIERIVDAVKSYDEEYGSEGLRFKLATGNVGVMAATNEAVAAAQFPMLMYVFAAIIVLCWVTFRSIRATLCIVIPLALVSLLAYALMTFLEIGLKVSTLPVAALGVGIGVDYGIYIFSRFQSLLDEGVPIREAFRQTLTITGNGVVFTGVTLAIGVATWIFSPLKFQADMGILLTFMFLVNMLGAILLLPALATFLLSNKYKND